MNQVSQLPKPLAWEELARLFQSNPDFDYLESTTREECRLLLTGAADYQRILNQQKKQEPEEKALESSMSDMSLAPAPKGSISVVVVYRGGYDLYIVDLDKVPDSNKYISDLHATTYQSVIHTRKYGVVVGVDVTYHEQQTKATYVIAHWNWNPSEMSTEE